MVPCSVRPDGEQSLDDVVVQVAGDAVAVGEHVEFAHPALSGGQLPGQRGLVGERGQHVELFVGEAVRAGGAHASSTPATVSVVRSGSTSAGPASSSTPVRTSRLSVAAGSALTEDLADERVRHRNWCRAGSGARWPRPISTTRSSVTSLVGTSSSAGTATRVASASVSLSASSAMSRNTWAGSVPDSSSVAMSRVASIQDCRVRDCS